MVEIRETASSCTKEYPDLLSKGAAACVTLVKVAMSYDRKIPPFPVSSSLSHTSSVSDSET